MSNETYDILVRGTNKVAVTQETRNREIMNAFSPYLVAKTRQALQEIADLLPDDLTDMQKVSLLYQCVASEGTYPKQPYRPTHSHFVGALRDREAVCGGYAELMTLLLGTVTNCRVYTVYGYITPDIEKAVPDSMLHAWNLVIFSDGSTYHLDVTWDLAYPFKRQTLKWLFLSDNEMKRYWLRDKYPAAPKKFTGKLYRNDVLLAQLRSYYRSLKSRFAQGMYTLPTYHPEESVQAS